MSCWIASKVMMGCGAGWRWGSGWVGAGVHGSGAFPGLHNNDKDKTWKDLRSVEQLVCDLALKEEDDLSRVVTACCFLKDTCRRKSPEVSSFHLDAQIFLFLIIFLDSQVTSCSGSLMLHIIAFCFLLLHQTASCSTGSRPQMQHLQ